MEEYHKINSVYKRNEDKSFIIGDWSNEYIEYLKDNIWEWTEKVNGTNIRVNWNKECQEVSFDGKTDNADISAALVKRLMKLFPANKFEQFDSSISLFGEGYGEGIRGGGNYVKDTDIKVNFVLFDVKIGDWWLRRKDVDDIAHKLNIISVPVVGHGTLLDAIDLVKTGLRSRWGDFYAEGLVMRPMSRLCTPDGKRIITKVKHTDFTLKG